jgi:hypothetical protein
MAIEESYNHIGRKFSSLLITLLFPVAANTYCDFPSESHQ